MLTALRVAGLLAVVATGCVNEAGAGQVVMQIHSTAGSLIDRVEIYGVLGGSMEGFSFPVDGALTFPVSQSILFSGNGPTGPLVVGAVGFRGPTPIVEQEWSTTFLTSESRVIQVELSDLCVGVICFDPERTCTPEGCVPKELNAATLPLLTDSLPPVERCNRLDDDNDGRTDESFTVPDGDLHCGACGAVCPTGVCTNGGCISSAVAAISAGGSHVCAQHQDGSVTCWGVGADFATGDPLTTRWLNDPLATDGSVIQLARSRRTPLMFGAAVSQVDAGGRHTCAVTGGTLVCLGSNEFGQFARAGLGFYVEPMPSDLTGVQQVSAGRGHTCVLLAGGEVRCAGANGAGQAGGAALGPNQPDDVTLAIPAATQVSAGGVHSCAVTTNGAVHCWGDNSAGQLGAPGGPAPVTAIASGARVVSAGERHTCAVLGDGSVSCWGDNSQGQLGVTGLPSSPTPVPVPGVSGAMSIDAAISSDVYDSGGGAQYVGNHTCVVTVAGAVMCWGANHFGQLGIDPSGGAIVSGPTMLVPSGARAVAAGNSVVCVLFSDTRIRCYGDNYFGMLGDWDVTDDKILPTGTDVLMP